MQTQTNSFQTTFRSLGSAYAPLAAALIGIASMVVMFSIGHPYPAAIIFIAIVFLDVLAERQARRGSQNMRSVSSFLVRARRWKYSLMSTPKDLIKNHSVLIFWSEQDKCFVAEAPDVPVSFKPNKGESDLHEQVEPLQGKGSSPARALADVLRRISLWARNQRVIPGRTALYGEANSFCGGRRATVGALLIVFVVGCLVLALSHWPRGLHSPSRPAQETASVPPAAMSAPAETAVVSKLEVASGDAASRQPRKLTIDLQWSAAQLRAGPASKINIKCTLTEARTTLQAGPRPAPLASYKICRNVVSTDRHRLTIELPERIPGGDYELQTAIWIKHGASELLVRHVSLPEANTSTPL
jgi:hypothetical protein